MGATDAEIDELLTSLLSCGLLSVNAGVSGTCDSELEHVRSLLLSAAPDLHVGAIMKVHCSKSCVTAYEAVRSTLGPERLLWHGTSWENVSNIARQGFNRAYAFPGSVARHGSRLGRGCYFAQSPKYAMRFCGRGDTKKALFLAGVLPGRYACGQDGMVEPPVCGYSNGTRFDSTVDDEHMPRVFCVFKDFQAVPLYLAEIEGM
jgi:hypothetical protein